VLWVVADPNVLVSGLISKNPDASTKQLLQGVRDGEVVLVASPKLLGELRAVLSRDKFRYRVSMDEVHAFVQQLRDRAQISKDRSDPPRASRDRTDDYLVALARDARAKLVSGDPDLADDRERERIREEHGIEILTPREVVEELELRREQQQERDRGH